MPGDDHLLTPSLAEVLDGIADGVACIDHAWRCTYLNAAAAALLGRTREQLLGQNIWTLFPNAVTLPVYGELQQALTQRQPVHLEAFYHERGLWLAIDLYPHAGGLSVVCRDITARKRAEVQAHFPAQLFDALSEAVIVTDLAGTITSWNRAAEELYGWSAVEVLGRHIIEITPTDQSREAATAILARLQAGERWTGAFGVRRRGGSPFLAQVTDLPVRDDAGQVIGIIGLSTDLSAQQATGAHEAWLASAVATSPDAVIGKDREGRVTHWNAAAERLYGYTAAEVLGQSITLLAPPGRGPELEQLTTRLNAGEVIPAFETQRRRKDGTILEVRLSASPVRDHSDSVIGSVAIARDISQQKATEHELARTTQLLAQVGDAVIAVDTEHRVTYWNAAAEMLYGRTAAEMLGHPLTDSHQVEWLEAGAEAAAWASLAERGSWQGENLHLLRDGQQRFVESSVITTTDARGQPTGLLAVIRDISPRKQAERYRDVLLAAVTHDLKSPLTTIGGIAQLLQRRLARDGAIAQQYLAENLERILASTQRVTALVEEQLDLARLQQGQALELQRSATDLVALTQAVCTEQQQLASGHTLRVVAAEPALVGGWDAGRLRRVVANLVGNAVKYSPAGGEVLVTIGRDAGAGQEEAVLMVTDHGLGIPEAEQAHIFTQFHRASNVLGLPGAGVGLASVQQIVAQHGGTVSVTSTLGVGSSFTVRLPLSQPGREAA